MRPPALNAKPGLAPADGLAILRALMLDKRVKTLEEAVAGVRDGATVLVGGFGNAGIPSNCCTP